MKITAPTTSAEKKPASGFRETRSTSARAADGSDALFDAPVAICVVRGADKVITVANDAFAELFARPIVAGLGFFAQLPELDAEGPRAVLESAFACRERTTATEVRSLAADRAIYVNLACAPSGAHDLVVTATDVTESVQTRQNLERLADLVQKGELRLRQLLAAADAGTWELDLYSGHEAADERFRTLLGLERFEPLPADLGAVHPEDRGRLRAAEARAIDRLEPFRVELRPAADPSRWIELRGEVVQGPGRRNARLSAIAVDITARKHAEASRLALHEATKDAKRSLERLGETVPQQVWSATPDGKLDFVNMRVTSYFGAAADDLLGDAWAAFVHPDDLGPTSERWASALASGETYEAEFRLRDGAGVYRWHLTRALPFRDASGRIAKWFGTNTDIDELKRTREQLERKTAYEQHLIGIVSHDLRGPLNSIGLAASLIAEAPGLPPVAARAVKSLQTSSRRASRLVHDILDFSRARLSDGIPVEPRPCDLGAMFQPLLDEAADAFPSRNVELEIAGDLQGMWDIDRMSQVVQNGLTNALRYSPPDTVVKVRALGHADAVELEVANSGTPIPPARLANVFEPLTRGDGEPESGHHGVGLGLFIVREIVAAHGGTVRLTSSAEEGTKLIVRVPRGGTRSG